MTIPVSVVFVCTGNMCRSPFAEHVFRDLGPKSVDACSAGITAVPGGTATPIAISAARRFGVDLSRHRACPLEEHVLRRASGIYVFEHRHRANIERLFPDLRSKIHLLGTFVGAPDGEIPDPLGPSEDRVVRCYEIIERACRALSERLQQP